MSDQQLLQDYAGHRSEPAFAELVGRHVDFVFSAALRMVRDAHLAEDVTQGVFVALARNAGQLAGRPVLSGWLHLTARNLAGKAVRSEVRRRAHEQEAAAMKEVLSAEPDAVWEHIAPHLDAALGELEEADRDALLLRYFEQKSAREIARTLGVSDEAAQKRVTRAVERLRKCFAGRGVTVGAGGLALAISAHAVQAAPVGLAATVTAAAALAGTAVATATTATATQAITMTLLQKTIIGAALAVAVGTGLYEARQNARLRDQVKVLQQQQAPLAEQIQELQRERDAATNGLAALAQEDARAREVPAELLKLRGQVGTLRAQLQAATNAARPAPRGASVLRQEEAFPNALNAARSNQVLAARAVIFSTTAAVPEKLDALRLLRSANARSDDVVKQMIQVYYSTDNPKWRADVFRQLSRVTAPELKPPLVEALRDTTQNTEIRQEAAETLAHYLPDPDAQAWLDHVIAHDPDEKVRAEARMRLERWQRH